MNCRVHTLIVCAVAVASCAEGPVDYPQATPTFSTSTAVPLGSSSDPKSKILESRTQQLIPATHLMPGHINAIALMGKSNGRVSYSKLKVTLSHTTATSLGADFAKNLPSPVVVSDRTNVSLDWKAGEWSEIRLVGFSYDGKHNLVVDIQKVARTVSSGEVTAATCGDPGRPDLPAWRYTAGGAGSDAWKSNTATSTSQSPIQMRLVFDVSWFGSTVSIRSDRLATGSKRVFAIGGTAQFALHYDPMSAPLSYALLVDTKFRAPVTIPGLWGRLIVRPLVIVTGPIKTHPTRLTVPIPRDTSLVGRAFRFQSVVQYDSKMLIFTNGVDAIVRSDV